MHPTVASDKCRDDPVTVWVKDSRTVLLKECSWYIWSTCRCWYLVGPGCFCGWQLDATRKTRAIHCSDLTVMRQTQSSPGSLLCHGDNKARSSALAPPATAKEPVGVDAYLIVPGSTSEPGGISCLGVQRSDIRVILHWTLTRERLVPGPVRILLPRSILARDNDLKAGSSGFK
jgi:hypothetical protein